MSVNIDQQQWMKNVLKNAVCQNGVLRLGGVTDIFVTFLKTVIGKNYKIKQLIIIMTHGNVNIIWGAL